MKIGLRGGHSSNCIGAVGVVDEYSQMQKYYIAVKNVFENYGHTVIDCNSNGYGANSELSEGVYKANNNNVDLFISLHMNCFNGQANGTETLVSSENSKAYPYAKRLVNNFAELGFLNRGVKFERLYEMNHCKAPNIISEICFCDSERDMDIYNKYSFEQLARVLCNAIDSNIPKDLNSTSGTWKQDTVGWWYVYSNGSYPKSQWFKVQDDWYYADDKGYCYQNRWLKHKDNWYYFKDNCKMTKNEKLTYKFNNNGEWING